MSTSAHNFSSDETDFVVGVDIGGTNMKLAVVDSRRNIVRREVVATKDLREPQDACRRIVEFVDEFVGSGSVSRDQIRNVGVAVPGVLEPASGTLREVANLPRWTGFPIRAALQELFGEHVAVSNDANAAAFAEYSDRHLTDESLALITLGTGTGCGVVLNGQPFSGDGGCGGEIGHAVINCGPVARKCGCGQFGHLEAYTGAAGVVETMRYKLDSSPGNQLLKQLAGQPLTPEVIAAEAERGNPLCLAAIDDTARFLGVGISILCQILNPSVVLLGGAMTFGGSQSVTGRRFLQRTTDAVRKNSLQQVAANVVLDFASLGSDAGMLGAAELAWHSAGEFATPSQPPLATIRAAVLSSTQSN